MSKDVFSYLVAHPDNFSLADLKTVEAITKQSRSRRRRATGQCP